MINNNNYMLSYAIMREERLALKNRSLTTDKNVPRLNRPLDDVQYC